MAMARVRRAVLIFIIEESPCQLARIRTDRRMPGKPDRPPNHCSGTMLARRSARMCPGADRHDYGRPRLSPNTAAFQKHAAIYLITRVGGNRPPAAPLA